MSVFFASVLAWTIWRTSLHQDQAGKCTSLNPFHSGWHVLKTLCVCNAALSFAASYAQWRLQLGDSIGEPRELESTKSILHCLRPITSKFYNFGKLNLSSFGCEMHGTNRDPPLQSSTGRKALRDFRRAFAGDAGLGIFSRRWLGDACLRILSIFSIFSSNPYVSC